jgi:hypothetical protein
MKLASLRPLRAIWRLLKAGKLMTITRSYRYKIIPRYHIHRYNDVVPPSVFDDDVIDTTVAAVTNQATSTAMPGWRRRIRQHTWASTVRQIDRFKWSGGVGAAAVDFVHITSPKGKTPAGSMISGQIFYPTSWPSLPLSSAKADNEARMKFFKRAKNAQTAFRSLTFLGELRETLGMIRNPARALRRGLDDYLKHVQKRARRANRHSMGRIVSESWLEHAFGWSPLISDIKSAGDALNRRLNRFTGSYTRISGKGVEESDSFDASLINGYADVFMRIVLRRLTRTYSSVRYVGEIRSVCENPIQADMTLFGANWTEIIPTAWELLPYSFLLDYFTNIGDILDAWSVRKSDITWCNRTERLRAVRTLSECRIDKAWTESSVSNFYEWKDKYVDSSYYRAVRESITRGANFPAYPSLRIEIPGFGSKWINMSALLASRNKTRRQLFR